MNSSFITAFVITIIHAIINVFHASINIMYVCCYSSSPRPLPDAPGARGGALPPLDLQAEKAKVKKKKKKPKKVASDHEQEDSGHEYS